MTVDLLQALGEREKKVTNYLLQPRFRNRFQPTDLQEAVFSYVERSGKRLRPAVLMWSCGAVGGDENAALSAAAGVEMFHTWTLVHDDLIDNDDLRRGGPTVHKIGERHASEKLGYGPDMSRDYGRDLAVLTGDSQHGWNVSLFCECALQAGVDAAVVLHVLNNLESHVVSKLIEGETLDIQFSRQPIDQITCDDIVRMLWMKTGVLYEFAARAGAMIGLGTTDERHPFVLALSRFASSCGTAFQLQDDILGLMGKEEKLGKPVGSDVREGKKTTIVYYALEKADDKQRDFLLSILGSREASNESIKQAIELMVSLGAVEKTAQLALEHVNNALPELEILPDSEYKQLLEAWAHYMVSRSF